MSRKNRGKGRGNYWQSEAYNADLYAKNLDMLLSIALNLFRWEGLPDTCDARYLQIALLQYGCATLSTAADLDTPVWTTLQAVTQGTYNMYGYPTKWQAVGFDGVTRYDVTPETGAVCFYNSSRNNPWVAITTFARRLAHIEQVGSNNVNAQNMPFVAIAPPEKQLELENLMMRILGGEPAVLGNEAFGAIADSVKTINTQTPFIGEELERCYQNELNKALMFLGVPHLAFEKGERMIEDEARANTAPTNIMLLDCLTEYRRFCKECGKLTGQTPEVYFNQDVESLNYNYTHNIEAQAQDGAEVMADGGESQGLPEPDERV